MATAEGLLKVARSQLGIREGAGGWTKYGAAYETRKHANGFDSAAWCDMFVGWCGQQAGLLAVVGDFAYTPYHADWFRDAGRWGQAPRKGAIVFYDWAGSHNIGAIDHVGIVEAIRADGSVVTIEGNTSNAVMRRVRRSGIAGYGYPKYPAAAPVPRPPASSTRTEDLVRQLPTLKRGATGEDVGTLQHLLLARSQRLPKFGADNQFGAETESALKAATGSRTCGGPQWAKLLRV